MASFDLAIGAVLAHEGGLVDDPADPGGLTNFGVSLRSYPELGREGVAAMTREQAEGIYRRDFWDPLRLGEVADQRVAGKVLDMAVNMGRRAAARLLQRALNYVLPRQPLTVDGIVGPATIAEVNKTDPETLLWALRAYHATHYVSLVEGPDKRFDKFSVGWLRRSFS